MDPFDHNFDQPIGSAPSNDNTHKDDYNDFFLQKPSKINTTIDFLNAETGAGHQVTSSGLENLLSGAGDELTKSVDSLVDNVSNKVHAEVTSGTDKVSEKAHEIVETVDKKLEDNDLLGLSTSALSPKEPTLEPIKQEEMHKSSALDHVKDVLFDDKEQDKQEVMHRPSAPDHVKDLLFDEKEQDELKGFDQYTSDSNASLKVNLSCENDDTASTKSIDSAQSIPLDEKKILAKENLIDDAPEVLSRITEDTLVSSESPKFSSPSPKESKSFVDNYENEFVSQEAPLDYIYESTPKVEHVAPPKPVGEKEVPKVVEKKEEKVSKPEPEVAKVKAPPVKKAPSTEMFIGPHEIFSRFGLDTWFNPEKLNPKVESLVYWRDPKLSGAVFGVSLAVLISLAYYSLISVVANLALLVLVGAIGFRIYKSILQAVQKTNEGHPFKEYLELDIAVPADKVKAATEAAISHADATMSELRRIFLVEDFVDSIKFVIILWTFTYVGSWFNGLTLVIIAFVALFTLPKVYENNKATIDANLEIVQAKIADITSKIKAAIPLGKKEEKKEQ